MRLALISDIHGNPIALDAVLTDIAGQGGADETWVLGDLAALGHDPIGVLDRLHDVPNAHFIRGNTDRYTVTGDRPPPSLEDVRRNPALQARYDEATRSVAWTRSYVAASGWLDWLAALPLERRLTLPDGTRLLAVHASPGRDDGPGIFPAMSDDELLAVVEDADADLIVVGHTHQALDRTVGGVRVVNLGSVSNPATPDLRAAYAMLEATNQGYVVQARRVEYDWQAVVAAIRAVRHPAADFLIQNWSRDH